MCKGLAVITEKKDNEWIVYAKPKESSYDKLLDELRDDLTYGITPHLKFEIIFPNQIRDDILQNVEYPKGYTETKMGKKVAVVSAFKAVSDYYYNHVELHDFSKEMLSGANLSKAYLYRATLSYTNLSESNLSESNLSHADLSHADLSYANLSESNLSKANLYRANLSYANLSRADLSESNLSEANLSYANLSYANLSEANLSYANLFGANLFGVRYNTSTKFPKNFDMSKLTIK